MNPIGRIYDDERIRTAKLGVSRKVDAKKRIYNTPPETAQGKANNNSRRLSRIQFCNVFPNETSKK